VNDKDEALRKARLFADTSYADALSRSTQELQDQLAVQRNQFGARGMLRSGNMMHATAKLYGKHIDDMVLAKLESAFEAYELYNVPIDEQLAANAIEEVLRLQSTLLINTTQTVTDVDRGGVSPREQFAKQVQRECKVSRNSVTVIAERKRLKRKEASAMNVVYQVSGYGRLNVNSTDNSVNLITVSQEEMFAKLRHAITTQVLAGEEQTSILGRLSALEAAQNSPSFAQRYAELISAAANHVTVLAPFLPALADMVRNWVGK
jgi:hypothetical protein